MEQTELTAWEKAKIYAREYMRARRAADPEKERERLLAWKKANPERVKAHRRAVVKKYKDAGVWREKRRESQRRFQAKYPDKVRAIKNAWNKANPEKVKLYDQRTRLKNYGLTLEQRDELFAMQGHRCGVCKSAEPGSTKGWHIDHCHETKRVRGILCNHCNLMLGYAKDNEATLASAIEYLRRNGAA